MYMCRSTTCDALRWDTDTRRGNRSEMECLMLSCKEPENSVFLCHGSWVPGPVLTVSCLYACAYV